MIHNVVYGHTKQEEIIKSPTVLIQRVDKCLLIIMDVLKLTKDNIYWII